MLGARPHLVKSRGGRTADATYRRVDGTPSVSAIDSCCLPRTRPIARSGLAMLGPGPHRTTRQPAGEPSPEPALCVSRTTSAYVTIGRAWWRSSGDILCARSVHRLGRSLRHRTSTSIHERAAGGASGRVDAPALRALGMPDPDSIGAVADRLVRNHEHAHGGDKRGRRDGRDCDRSRDHRDQHGRGRLAPHRRSEQRSPSSPMPLRHHGARS
jgi:hypothetical protein